MYALLKRLAFLAVCSATLLLSGCLRTYEIISTEFPQAQKHEPSYQTIKEYLRSMTVYEGFETRAHFDVLWMSDDMHSMYAALHSAKVGHNDNERDAYLVRQLEENNHTITFYLLTEIHDQTHISLSDKNSVWSAHLELANGHKIAPTLVKEVDFEPEMRFLFGHRFTPLKKTYLIQFAAKDVVGSAHLQPGQKFSMTCAGPGISKTVSWHIPLLQRQSVLQKKHELKAKDMGGLFSAFAQFAQPKQKDEDFYW